MFIALSNTVVATDDGGLGEAKMKNRPEQQPASQQYDLYFCRGLRKLYSNVEHCLGIDLVGISLFLFSECKECNIVELQIMTI